MVDPVMDKTTASQDQPTGQSNEAGPIVDPATQMNWDDSDRSESSESESTKSKSSGWHSPEDELAEFVVKRVRGQGEPDPDYNPADDVNPEEEVW